jgi:eukaryotic-like serine/threonine-protein kinase
VLGTGPGAGTKVPKGSTVTLGVAVEPGVDIPDVRGKSADDAAGELSGLSLQVTQAGQANDTIPAGQAIGTDPATGTRVPRNSPVRLFVSTGPAERDVPTVIGQTQGAATNQLVSEGFSVVVNFTPAPGSAGIVVSQAPAGGRAPRGSTVTIVVGN